MVEDHRFIELEAYYRSERVPQTWHIKLSAVVGVQAEFNDTGLYKIYLTNGHVLRAHREAATPLLRFIDRNHHKP